MKRSRDAVERAKANEGLMRQAYESRNAHQRGERGIWQALRKELERREQQ
jgi:hypothetical protein